MPEIKFEADIAHEVIKDLYKAMDKINSKSITPWFESSSNYDVESWMIDSLQKKCDELEKRRKLISKQIQDAIDAIIQTEINFGKQNSDILIGSNRVRGELQ